MKLNLIVVLVLAFVSIGFSQEATSFKDLKKGTFHFTTHYGEDVKVVRKRRRQIEYLNNGKSKLIFHIKWTKEDEYILFFKRKVNIGDGCLKKNDWIKTTITTRDDDKYNCTYSTKNCGSGKATIFIK